MAHLTEIVREAGFPEDSELMITDTPFYHLRQKPWYQNTGLITKYAAIAILATALVGTGLVGIKKAYSTPAPLPPQSDKHH